MNFSGNRFTRATKMGVWAFTLTGLLSGCGGSSGGSGGSGDGNIGGRGQPRNRVDWSTIPSEFNPKIETIEFSTSGFDTIGLNVFGFSDDVEVVYSKDIPTGYGVLKIYTVWHKQASFGSLEPRRSGSTLNLVSYGSYQCSKRITNGRLTEVDGGCYLRLQVFLPPGTEIEVYNVGELLTKRFRSIDTETFLASLERASFDKEKFEVIENFLASYDGMSRRPTLLATQLGKVIRNFAFKDAKFKVLRRLHPIVSDRQNLGKMIDDEFGYFEREEARRIVGILAL